LHCLVAISFIYAITLLLNCTHLPFAFYSYRCMICDFSEPVASDRRRPAYCNNGNCDERPWWWSPKTLGLEIPAVIQ